MQTKHHKNMNENQREASLREVLVRDQGKGDSS